MRRSHECDYPPSVSRLPICTAPKFPTEGSSGEIDRRVKGLLQQALSIYRVDADLLRQLRPTHIITQTQCEVCAVSLKEVEEALREWISPGTAAERIPTLISLAPNSLSDIWADKRVADAIGVSERGFSLVHRLQKRMAAVAREAKSISQRPRRRD